MENIPHEYHRRSIRLPGYDYSLAGAYFITILAYRRIELFGCITDGKLWLNLFGEIARGEWINTANLRPNISLFPDEMVIMPNHIHGIIRINQLEINPCKGAATLRPYEKSRSVHRNVSPGSLGAIVRAYKSAVAYRINALRNSPGAHVWQRNYYDHIIRNEGEFRKIWDYIDTNPQSWADDQLHPL